MNSHDDRLNGRGAYYYPYGDKVEGFEKTVWHMKKVFTIMLTAVNT